MAERSLRGSRLGALSMETDQNVVPSERRMTEYACPNGHSITLPFSVEAEVPATWECRCGAQAKLVGGVEPEAKPARHQRTHWDMLLERRSIPELEELLEERLALLRASRGEKTKRKTA
ncbi:MAG: RNA polymerase-binding protein RbpA [Phycicoccus sp.]